MYHLGTLFLILNFFDSILLLLIVKLISADSLRDEETFGFQKHL